MDQALLALSAAKNNYFTPTLEREKNGEACDKKAAKKRANLNFLILGDEVSGGLT